SEVVFAKDGNDVLDGGGGRDSLNGGTGDDVYRFASGYVFNEIYDDGGADVVELSSDISPDQISLIRVSTNLSPNYTGAHSLDGLMLTMNGGSDQLLIDNFFVPDGSNAIEEIHFADGTVWNAAAIAARVTDQSGTQNSIAGTSGNDVFVVDNSADT